MTPFRTPLAIGVAALAIVAGGVALAQMKNAHVLTVRLPDGSVEQIRYSGKVAPEVVVRPGEAPLAFAPADDPFDAGLPLAGIDRVFAEMDRQAAAMLREVDPVQMAAMQDRAFGPRGLMQADIGSLPAGIRSYSVVTTIEGGRACTRSVQLTGGGPGAAPKVLTSSSGDCHAIDAPTVPATAPEPGARSPGVVQASYGGYGTIKTAPHPTAVTD
jgi:hypothetical protein